MKTILLILLVSLSLISCADPGSGVIEPPLPTIQDWFEQDVYEARDNLGVEALKRSSLYATLGDNGPGMFAYISNDDALRAYIAEQGLSEEAFLSHSKLDDFVRAHLLDEPFDFDAVNIEGETLTYEMAFGNNVTFEEAPTQGANGRDLLANDVRFSSTCAGFGQQEIRLCFAEGPLVDDFDWGE